MAATIEVQKKTLAVLHSTLEIGGVQQNCFQLMKYAAEQGYRVVWLYSSPKRIADAYSGLNGKIEAYPYKIDRSYKNIICDPHFCENESINLLTFTPGDMHCAILLAHNNRNCHITPLYIVSNTKGRYNYIERYYWGIFASIVYKKFKSIIHQWHDAGLIRYFHIKQYDAYNQSYGINSTSPHDLIWKSLYPLPPLDKEVIEQRTERKGFNIISVSRFDFPHKQYLLGLIKDFAVLKQKYPHIQLHIVGYGHDEDKVTSLIRTLPIEVQNDITLYGQKSTDEIVELMKNMHLNISVAGCVGLGARTGLLSIPARNFCGPECEVYGYLPESKDKTVATEPGHRAIDFIEEVINMTDDEYRRKCVDSYNAYKVTDVDPDFMLKQMSTTQDYSFERNNSTFFTLFIKTRDYFWKLGDIVSKMIK